MRQGSAAIAFEKLGTIARTLTIVVTLAGEPSACASCGPTGPSAPEPQAPRSDPLPAPDLAR